MARVKFLKPFGAPQASQFFFTFFLSLPPRVGRPRRPNFYLSFTAAKGGGFPNGRRRCPKEGDEGAAPPEDEGNPTEGGCFASYILTVLDVFSKYAWAISIKNKSGCEVSNAFQQIFKERMPRKLHTDKGTEFINKTAKDLLKKHEIHWFATENNTEASVIERFNRTLKNRM